jgi:hypothetical protein
MKSGERRGTMSEWSVALGLGLKMTTAHFGSRDGTSRETQAANVDIPLAPQAEVVDLNRAINREPVQSAAPAPAQEQAAEPKPEVANA